MDTDTSIVVESDCRATYYFYVYWGFVNNLWLGFGQQKAIEILKSCYLLPYESMFAILSFTLEEQKFQISLIKPGRFL